MKNKTILFVARFEVMVGSTDLLISSSSSSGLSLGTLFAFGAIVGMPIAFAFMGYVMGIVEAACHKILKAKFPSLRTPIDSLG